MIRRLALAAVALTGSGAAALEIEIPVRCAPGRDCYIQSYVDRADGPEVTDFTCGTLSYDGHDGTDIRVATLRDMARGVDVLAAAPGTVRAIRDGDPDDGLAGVIAGRECGNGLAIHHGDGWETQYCHLAKGSVSVRAGQFVAAGDVLGQIGLSGRTEFPHLHFTVRRDGETVDPFDARAPTESCALDDAGTLWSDTALARLTYRPGGVVDKGFADGAVDLAAVRAGAVPGLRPDRPAIVFWTRFYGLRPGDKLDIRLGDASRTIIAQSDTTMPRARAEHMVFVGAKRPAKGWKAGRYIGTATLIRDGQPYSIAEDAMTVP